MATIASRLVSRLTSERLPRVTAATIEGSPATVHQALIGLLVVITTLIALLGFASQLIGLLPGVNLVG